MVAARALDLLKKASGPQGLLASPHVTDNYARIWSRDAVIGGIAGGIAAADESLYEGLKISLRTLMHRQSDIGIIPSNVAAGPADQPASYGSLAGRVDATAWWAAGAALTGLREGATSVSEFLPALEKAFSVMEAWEFNGRGLMYVPLGGNWADEYVIQGYTLYDQLLRLWALETAAKVWLNDKWQQKAAHLRQLLRVNFCPETLEAGESHLVYHAAAWESLKSAPLPYLPCALAPNGYDRRWDLAANALALLLRLVEKPFSEKINTWITDMAAKNGHWLLPAFAPVIHPDDADWKLLHQNFRYRFKNHPYHFHNGGAWPVFLGWLGAGLHSAGFAHTAHHITTAVHSAISAEPFVFYEYWDIRSLTPGGMPELSFSAAGALLLEYGTTLSAFLYED